MHLAFITKVTTVFQLFALLNHKLRPLSSGVLSETSTLSSCNDQTPAGELTLGIEYGGFFVIFGVSVVIG